MTTHFIHLPDAARIQRFVAALSGLPGDFDLLDGNRILDARSLMGIFSLDLTQPIQLKIHHESPEVLEALGPFIVKARDQA